MIKRFVIFLKKSSTARTVLIGLSLCLIVAILILAIYQNFGSLLVKSTPLPVNLHSSKQANYSLDPGYMQIQPMELQLVIDAIWDQNPNIQDLPIRLTQVSQNFIESVASITPQPPTSTESFLTDTPLPDNLLQTTTPALENTGTSLTGELTETSLPPTDTGIPGIPTVTGSPSTSTAIPQLPTSTNTSPPPTNTSPPPTNTSSPCGSISIGNFYTETKRANWSVNNNSAATISISQINLSWPAGNDSLDKIFLGSSKIWDQTAPPPSVVISSGWTGGSRIIGSSANQELIFTFISQSMSSGYNLTVWFTNGCSINKAN